MRRTGTCTITRKELSQYFNSPIAYIFIIVFAALIGSLFMSQFFLVALADMRIFFHFLPLVLCVFIPAITMRFWAEEKRGNTYELLLTFPMKPHELVLGKFVASFVFYLAALAATLPIPLMLKAIGNPDMGPIIGGYIGAAFLGALFLSIGIFVSGFFKDQIVAFIISMIVCFGIYLIGTEFIASSIDSWLPGFGSFLRTNLGVGRHFDSFQKGVIDLRDVLYFGVGSAVFLTLNGFWVEGRMRPKQNTIFTSAVLVSVSIFLLSNWFLSDISIGRFDLTAGKIYTVSSFTKKMLRNLKAPVTIKYYVSPQDKMPTGIKTLEQDVTDKLDEFRVASKGNFNYKMFHMDASNISETNPMMAHEDKDPSKQSLEDTLQQKGIQPFQVQSIEADEVGVKLIYSALAIAYKERTEEIIPRIVPSSVDDLEYLIMSKVYRMTLDETPKVALFAPEREITIDPQTKMIMEQMGQQVPPSQKIDEYKMIPMALDYEGYQNTRIELTKESPIPEGTKTLVVLDPKELTEDQKADINKFLVQGGSVFLAAQGYVFEYGPGGRGSIRIMPQKQNIQINSLLSKWGLGIVDDQFLLDENQETLSISAGAQMGPFALSIPLQLPFHIRVDSNGMNPDVSITSRLPSLLYLWGSALKVDENKLKESGLKERLLFKSSRDSWMIPAQDTPITKAALQRTAANQSGPFPLSVMVEGQFPSASEKSTEILKPAPGKLILVGDAAMFQEQLLQKGGHMDFLLNSVDALTLSEELVQIRSKQTVDRSVKRVQAAEKIWWRFFATLLIPIILAVIGGIRIFLRKQSKDNYIKMIKAA